MKIILFAFILLSSVVHAIDKRPLHWAGCGITKKAFMAELAQAFEKYYGIPIVLEGGGATKGIRRVGDYSVELGGSCRPKLRGAKEERKVKMNPVAWDALVVMVHPSNPVNDISIAQLKAIYEGKITNWKELGGKDAPIEVMVRGSRISGVGYTLRVLVWQNLDQEFKATHIFPSSGPLEKAVEQNPNAIGVSGIASANKRQVKLLRLEGKEPNYENIKNGEYLLYRPLYLTYMNSNPRITEILQFVNFAHSPLGRKIIKEQGVVPYLDASYLMLKYRAQPAKIRQLQLKTQSSGK